MLIHKFLPPVFFIFLTVTTFAQQNNDEVKLMPSVVTIEKGGRTITFPSAPQGYHFVLKGSDHNPIIDSTGRIVTPLESTTVSLYFQLIKNNDDTVSYDVSKQVTVPGKYADSRNNPKPFVIPALREWHGGKGDFLLKPSAKIVIDTKDKNTLLKLSTLLKKEVKEQTGLILKTRFGLPKQGDIFLTLHEKDTSIGKEGYYFKVDNFITISAYAYSGLFWGTRTLLQLLEPGKSIPMGIARDYPEFKVRGFVLDDGRKFFTLQFLQDYVKLLSYYKMNDFQIHLNDNGSYKYFDSNWDSTYSAFRLENETYPQLTAKDGSYTKKDFIALQQLGDDYAVRIVPEIDVPAHSLAFSKAVPSIGSKRYCRDHLDLHNPLTDTVIQNIFKEYLSGSNPVFKGNLVDIGTD